MNKDGATYELSQQYLKGNLSGEQLRDFEKRLSRERDFRNYVESHQLADELIKQNELNVIRNELKKIHLNNRHSGGSWKLISVIFVGLIVGFFTWKYFSSGLNKNETEIASKTESIPTKKNVDKKIVIDSELELKMNDKKVDLFFDQETMKNEDFGEHRTEERSTLMADSSSRILDEMNKKNISNESLVGSEKPTELSPIEETKISVFDEHSRGDVVDCDPFEVDLHIEVYSSCRGKKEGVIKINNDTFSPNFQFAVDQLSPKSENVFTKLSVGEHKVYVVDEKGCKSEVTFVNVTERSCEFIISPSQEVYWEIPIEFTLNKNAFLTVYDANGGNLVYATQLNSSESATWNGRDANDRSLPMGLYIYKISIGDTQFTGEISILN